MAEQKSEVSFLMRRVTDRKEVIFTTTEFMSEILKRLKGSDPLNDEIQLRDQTFRLSSLEMFNGKARLRISVSGGVAGVRVDNAGELEPGLYEANYKEAVTLTPDQSKYRFSRWEGAHASEVQSLGEGRYSLLMDSVEKELVAVFEIPV